MTATFEIRDAKYFDCGRIARMLRVEHEAALIRLGVHSHREIRSTFEASCYRKAFLIDGKLAGLGGVMAPLLSPAGFVWLALSDRATRYPMAIIKYAKKHLAEVMVQQMKTELHTTVLMDDPAALRLAIFLGFHVSDEGLGSAAETRSGRRTLREYIVSTPELHLQHRDARLVVMGYHARGDDLPSLSH